MTRAQRASVRHVPATTPRVDDGRMLAADGAPAHEAPAEVADRCARQVDELAAQVEQATGLAGCQLPETPPRQHQQLRVVAAGLGELHATLDQLATDLDSQQAGDRDA